MTELVCCQSESLLFTAPHGPTAAISKMEIVRFVGESACSKPQSVMVTRPVVHG